jgi:hypothetical protein
MLALKAGCSKRQQSSTTVVNDNQAHQFVGELFGELFGTISESAERLLELL